MRPFPGTAPGRLIATGTFRGLLYGMVVWLLARSLLDKSTLGDSGIARVFERLEPLLVVVAVGLTIGVLAGIARVVVGVSGLIVTRTFTGTVIEVSTKDRRGLGVLLRRRSRPSDGSSHPADNLEQGPRRVRCSVVLETPDGKPTTFDVRVKFHDPGLVGHRVELFATGYNHYVRALRDLDAEPSRVAKVSGVVSNLLGKVERSRP